MKALTRRWRAAVAAFAAATLVLAVSAGLVLQSRLAIADGGGTSALWTWLLLTWAAGVLLSAVALAWAQRTLTNTLQSLVASVHAGRAETRGVVAPDDSVFAGIAGSVQRMADERDDAMQSLATERDRFEAVLETMAPAVLALDARRNLTTANRTARLLFDITSAWDGAPLVEVIRLPSLHAFVDGVFKDGASETEIELPGTQRHIRARASRLGDGGVVIVADDTTEIRRLERVRSDFVANVSHELRTPIAVIRANAETLLDGALESPEAAEPFVTALFRHADRLGRLIAELLDISALEAGKRVLASEEFELADVVDDVLVAHQQAAAEREMVLHADISHELWLLGDWKATEQILFNFIDNAIKYGRRGGRVDLTAAVVGKFVRVEIRDDGPGIEPQHHARLFERFYRVDSGRSRDAGGTGLGLSIAKHLAEAMGGSIGVLPRSPHGSIFWVTLHRGDGLDAPEDPDVT